MWLETDNNTSPASHQEHNATLGTAMWTRRNAATLHWSWRNWAIGCEQSVAARPLTLDMSQHHATPRPPHSTEASQAEHVEHSCTPSVTCYGKHGRPGTVSPCRAAYKYYFFTLEYEQETTCVDGYYTVITRVIRELSHAHSTVANTQGTEQFFKKYHSQQFVYH